VLTTCKSFKICRTLFIVVAILPYVLCIYYVNEKAISPKTKVFCNQGIGNYKCIYPTQTVNKVLSFKVWDVYLSPLATKEIWPDHDDASYHTYSLCPRLEYKWQCCNIHRSHLTSPRVTLSYSRKQNSSLKSPVVNSQCMKSAKTAILKEISESDFRVFIYLFILISWGGERLSPLGASATVWPIVPAPRMIDDNECETVGGMRIGRENSSIRRKPAPVPLCSPQIPHDLTWDRTRTAAVGSRRATNLSPPSMLPGMTETLRCVFKANRLLLLRWSHLFAERFSDYPVVPSGNIVCLNFSLSLAPPLPSLPL
jgi:hypothetical protein